MISRAEMVVLDFLFWMVECLFEGNDDSFTLHQRI